MDTGKEMKLAIWRCMEPQMQGFQTVASDVYERLSTYVRISEYVTVTFEPLKDTAVIQGALKALDAAEQSVRVKLQREIDVIRESKSQLLALVNKAAPPGAA